MKEIQYAITTDNNVLNLVSVYYYEQQGVVCVGDSV